MPRYKVETVRTYTRAVVYEIDAISADQAAIIGAQRSGNETGKLDLDNVRATAWNVEDKNDSAEIDS